MTWMLDRPRPALPNSYVWTWDHSANWVLDDPGMLTFGADNRYLKRAETFVEDYRRLTDLAAGLGVRGIVIWGFLRDAHGGIDAAKRVADYAAARDVAILPGVGTTWYGGVYYEGDHRFNIRRFAAAHDGARMLNERGEPYAEGICPSHPAFREWLADGMRWLFDEFAVGGVNLENGDFMVCHCPRCREHKRAWPAADPDFFRLQAMSYQPALEAVADRLPHALGTWATYTGFLSGAPPSGAPLDQNAYMRCARPELVDRLPAEAVGQWTLTGMVRPQPLPLTAYLDDGAPAAVFDNPLWPADLRPPTRRSVGFLHQGSQWSNLPTPAGRCQQIVGTIKEGCLRAARAGLEGVSIHGEVSDRYVPWALNYLAFSHFIHWPEDTLRAFGRVTLGPVLGAAEQGEAFVDIFARWDAGSLDDEHRREARSHADSLRRRVAAGHRDVLESWRFWHWLAAVAADYAEPHTVGFF